MKNERPNIVLINCDDLGYGDLGCYGSTANDSPTIDMMAAQGMKLTDFYMASPVCSPSRGAMMTGCYPPRIGFGEFDGEWVLFPGQGLGLNPNEITMAGLLKNADYNTMLVGKWHCGDQEAFLPTNHGFDHYYGLPYSNDMGIQNNDLNRGFPPLPLMSGGDVIQEQPDQSSLTERYVEKTVGFIRDNKERPFFLYLAHMHVHVPHYAPERFNKESRNGEYGASVGCIDWSTDVILKELKSLGLEENTLVIFTSDNGSNQQLGGCNDPLRGSKATTWEGGLRVPCIMYWPGVIKGGQVINDIVTSLEFLPTFASLAGTKVPDDRIIDGRDISGLITDTAGYEPREFFFYYKLNSLEAIRHNKWKLTVLRDGNAVRELYDLEGDISETRNLYNKYPQVVADLEKHLEDCRADIGDEATGTEGKNNRPIGKVNAPRTLTCYDSNHPYIIAMYDKPEFG